ncbi:MAG TPA: MltA domain-containing protein [Thermoanaerobaculia bacterium]|nr:MltA domain-containing protein [Thermoanaerobaculia bacterium]
MASPHMTRRLVLGLVLVLLALLLAWWWSQRLDDQPGDVAAPAEPAELSQAPPQPRLELTPADFAELPGWGEDDPGPALAAFRRSCEAFGRLPGDRPIGLRADGYGGTAADWRPVCEAAEAVDEDDAAAVRAFFASRFRPLAVANHADPVGLFTGYYEPTLHGSRRRGGRYQVPVYARPPELVMVDLGDFRSGLRGNRLAGRVRDGRLEPYHDRTAIEEGALAGRGLEIVWVDDPVDAFFLEIQGSGVVVMDDGSRLRLGYEAQNGWPYYAIGRELIARGSVPREEMSMQAIRDWLEANPEAAVDMMRTNPSFVFFRRLSTSGAVGAQGVVLTPGRSLAVDREFHPLGVPMWLAAEAPSAAPGEPDRPFRRLLVAQDTGGAIRDPVRGDVFWGPGDEAAEIAGRMKHQGRLWVLLPNELAAGLAS